MAKDEPAKVPAVVPEARAVVTVRALQTGTSVSTENGRHALRARGELFEIFKDQHAVAWQELVTDTSKPPPKLVDPPQTTLPAHMQPRTSNG